MEVVSVIYKGKIIIYLKVCVGLFYLEELEINGEYLWKNLV